MSCQADIAAFPRQPTHRKAMVFSAIKPTLIWLLAYFSA
jgi:hypothetical protein